MRHAWWLNAALAVVVAALALFVFLKPGAPDPAGHALTALKAGAARSIRIERPGAPAIALEKKGDDWLMTAPLAARANLMRVQLLLAITDARSEHRFAATDLDRFGLERPEVRLTINGQSFDFGVVNPVSREQYVLTGNAVYTVGFRYAAALPGGPVDLIDTRPLSPPAAPGASTDKK